MSSSNPCQAAEDASTKIFRRRPSDFSLTLKTVFLSFLLSTATRTTMVDGLLSRSYTSISISSSAANSRHIFMSAPVGQEKGQRQLSDEEEWQDPDAPAGIEGAEFFGGNKQKEEFYDPVAEREVALEVQEQASKATTHGRFLSASQQPSEAFDNLATARLGEALQQKINGILYSSPKTSSSPTVQVEWTQQLSWETPFTTAKGSTTPVSELQSAKDFYKEMDVAIVSGRQISDSVVELSWELAVVWPTFWAPRVLLCGTSTLTLMEGLNDSPDRVAITKQVDNVFGCSNNNLLPLLSSQIKPRFWDWYHIGMSPSTELLPRDIVQKKEYSVCKIPSRLVLKPTIVETGTRKTRNAQIIPNHAFTCIIKTMGPQKQDYIPTSPVQVEIGKLRRKIAGETEDDKNQLELSWTIPLSVQFLATNNALPLPGENPEDREGTFPTCTYELQPARQVATMAFGGNVQDPEITDIRKQLYEQVLRDGWKPKLDEDGRPLFFFWQNDVKACYTVEGLGMSIYEWRPAAAKSNEVGLELQIE